MCDGVCVVVCDVCMYDVAMVCVSLTASGGVHGSGAYQLVLLLSLLLQPILEPLAHVLCLVLVLGVEFALFPPRRLAARLPATIGLPLLGWQIGRG